MAVFKGTFEELKKYIDPYFHNKIQKRTSRYKKKLNLICEGFGKPKAELEGHHYGLTLPEIIENILKENFGYSNESDIISVDLEKFEKLLLEAHDPIEDHIYFLCEGCHDKIHNGTDSEKSELIDQISQNRNNRKRVAK